MTCRNSSPPHLSDLGQHVAGQASDRDVRHRMFQGASEDVRDPVYVEADFGDDAGKVGQVAPFRLVRVTGDGHGVAVGPDITLANFTMEKANIIDLKINLDLNIDLKNSLTFS